MTSPARPRVLLLIPSMNFGGAQRVLHGHSEALAEDFDVAECVFNRELGVAFPGRAVVHSLDVSGGGSPLTKAWNLARRVTRLRALKQELATDVCISHLEGADYVNVLSRGREKVVLCVHGTKLHDANIAGATGLLRKRLLIPRLYRRADAIVTVSQAIRHELVEELGLPAEKVLAIPNFFEVERIEAKAREPLDPRYEPLFAQHPTVITSGRLVVQKNQAELLEVHARLVRVMPRARLVFLGDGELRAELLARCAALGLSVHQGEASAPEAAQVVFMGFQDNPFRTLARASVFALPSEWEGFPMALGEAMAVGLPVLSADCPTGPRELLTDEGGLHRPLSAAERAAHGILLPRLQGAVAARQVWADELATVLGDEALRRRYAGAARARIEAFSRTAVMDRWKHLLRALLK